MLSAHAESFLGNRTELSARFPAHFELMGKPMQTQLGGSWELAPKWEQYTKLEGLGALLCVVLRDSSRLVGYWVQVVDTGLHYERTITAYLDMWYLDEGYREGAAPLVLGRAVQRALRARGVKLWTAGEKLHRPAGRLYAALGMIPVEQTWGKWLGE